MVAAMAQFLKDTWGSLFRQGGVTACDGFRMLALMSVMLDHSYQWLQDYMEANWFTSIMDSGELGVDLFLVLSGFLIGGAMLREFKKNGEVDLVVFYIRRFFRIVPTYAVTVMLTWLLDIKDPFNVDGSREVCSRLVWTNALFINNYYNWPVSCLPQSWSIAVEMQLYLVTPLIFILAKAVSSWSVRLPSHAALVKFACGLGWFVSLLWRCEHEVRPTQFLGGLTWSSALYFHTQFRMGAYLAGVYIGVAMEQEGDASSKSQAISRGRKIWRWMLFALASAIVILSWIMKPDGDGGNGFSGKPGFEWVVKAQSRAQRPIFCLAAAYFLFSAASGAAPCLGSFLGVRAWKPIAALAYSMYLVQYIPASFIIASVFGAIQSKLEDGSQLSNALFRHPVTLNSMLAILCFLLHTLASIPVALLMYTFVERPGIMLGKHAVSALLWARKRCCTQRTDPAGEKLPGPVAEEATSSVV